MVDNYTPLDPDEGPPVWARQLTSNRHTIEIVTGTDPTDPTDAYQLSHGEIETLATMVPNDE
jgi:hypothetical protein